MLLLVLAGSVHAVVVVAAGSQAQGVVAVVMLLLLAQLVEDRSSHCLPASFLPVLSDCLHLTALYAPPTTARMSLFGKCQCRIQDAVRAAAASLAYDLETLEY